MKVCSVEGCGGKAIKREWCNKHYKRFIRHGDPLAGCTSAGRPAQWVLDHLSHEDDGCLIWPYSKTTNGYGLIVIDGKNETVHKVIVTILYGKKPTEHHQVRHLCGRGHMGCVNPVHLAWGTGQENMQDKLLHGTDGRGEKSGMAKLSNSDVISIIGKIASGQTNRSISREYEISECVISSIKCGFTWSWLTGIKRDKKHC